MKTERGFFVSHRFRLILPHSISHKQFFSCYQPSPVSTGLFVWVKKIFGTLQAFCLHCIKFVTMTTQKTHTIYVRGVSKEVKNSLKRMAFQQTGSTTLNGYLTKVFSEWTAVERKKHTESQKQKSK